MPNSARCHPPTVCHPPDHAPMTRRRGQRVAASGIACVLAALAMAFGSAPLQAQRPPVTGRTAGVSTGHPLATAAAFETLVQGGNAFDAGVTAMLVGGVVEQDLYGLGGEALILVYPAAEGEVTSIVGQGWAPKGASIEWYTERDRDLNGQGLDPGVVPGALHGVLTVLERWGTMTFEQVAARAIDYAEHGFPLRPLTARAIEDNVDFLKAWPENRRFWLKPDGAPYAAGETIALPALAGTLRKMVEAEQAHAHLGGPAPWPLPATGSTRATSPRRWSPSCRRTARRSTAATSPSSIPASKHRAAPTTAATPSTSRGSTARGRCCCRR